MCKKLPHYPGCPPSRLWTPAPHPTPHRGVCGWANRSQGKARGRQGEAWAGRQRTTPAQGTDSDYTGAPQWCSHLPRMPFFPSPSLFFFEGVITFFSPITQEKHWTTNFNPDSHVRLVLLRQMKLRLWLVKRLGQDQRGSFKKETGQRFWLLSLSYIYI